MEKFIRLQDAQNAPAFIRLQGAQNTPAFVRLQEYSLADFVAKIQDLVQQGYEFDFKSNESYPVQIGNMFAAGLFIKESVTEEVQADQAVQAVVEQTEVKPAVRRGRK